MFGNIETYWIWIALACIFLAIEVLVVPTGFFLCMGSAAAIVAVLMFLVPGISWLWATTIFSVLMVVAGLFWWKVLRKRSRPGAGKDTLNAGAGHLVGYTTVLNQPLIHGRGRIRIMDSSWPVEADADYPAGTRVRVVSLNGITLRVEAVDE